MSIRSLTFQVVAMMAIPAFAAYHESTDYRFTFSSFAREGVITLPTEGEARGAYHLSDEIQVAGTTIYTPVFDRVIDVTHLVTEEELLKGTETERPVAYIPKDLTLTSISIVTPSDAAPDTLILSVDGTTTHRIERDPRVASEAITLHGTLNGSVGTRNGFVHTYTVAQGDTILLNKTENEGTEHHPFEVAFESNDAGGQVQNRNVYCVDGRPYLRIAGTATLEHHIFTIDAAHDADHANSQSLATLLEEESKEPGAAAFDDDPNTIIVVEFEGNGGAIDLDQEVLQSPIVFGSSVTPDKAHVHFPGTVKLESALTFRDGAEQGGVSIYGPTDTANYEAARWNPSAMLLRCDLTLCTPLPPLKDSWFLTHSTTIPAGRTFRLDLPSVTSEANLPNLDFADATSRLELASSIGGQTLAPKYLDLLTTQSGTLVLDRDVTYSSNLMLRAKAPGLNTTIIQKSGTFSCRNFYVLPSEDDANTFESFTFLQEGGTFEVTGQSFTIEATQKRIQVGGEMTLASSPTLFEEGSTTVIDVNKGGTLTLGAGLVAGDAATTAALDLTVKGTLNLDGDLHMTPVARREFRLEGGTIASTRYVPEVVNVICKDGTAAEADDFVIVSGGGTLKGSLTVDGISGTSSETSPLIIDTGATVKDLRDFAGTVSGAGRLEAIEGTLGDVTLGEDWITSATDGKTLGDVLTGWTEGTTPYHGAADFAGTIGFTAGSASAQKKLDFSDLDELTSLGMAFRINNHQHVIMRLDQYADAVIRWPDNPEGITLTLIESGAYGGELTLPHFPHTEGTETGVTFEFAYFNPDDPLGYTVREGGYTHSHSEDGVNDILTWDNPVFTGEGAWIDIEFNGDTYNTGWFTLKDQNGVNVKNGMLRGDEGTGAAEIMTNPADFSPVTHPANATGGLSLARRPYVSFGSLPSYPEEWSCALRFTAPSTANTCILAIGNNTRAVNTSGGVNAVVFATGATADTIVCYRFTETDPTAGGAIVELSSVKLPDIQHTPHVFSVVCDGRAMTLYMDGAWLTTQNLPEGWALGCGMQVGSQLGGEIKDQSNDATQGVPWDFWRRAVPATDGVIDYLRFYKGALTDVAMTEMAEATPSVQDADVHARYVRHVGDDGDTTWVQAGQWQRQTWDGSAWVDSGEPVAEPAECSYLYLYVKEGDHALGVNVQRDAANLFYSPNRNYAALVVGPEPGNTAAGTLRLVPYGASGTGTGDTLTDAIDASVAESAWFTTEPTDTTGNRTGYQYGIIRFTGGAGDPITDEGSIAADFHGSAYLISGSTSVEVTAPEVSWSTDYSYNGFSTFGTSGTATRTGTRTVSYKYEPDLGQSVKLIADGGVAYFSKYANVVLTRPFGGTVTISESWSHTAPCTRYFDWGWTYNEPSWAETAPSLTSSTPNGTLTPQGEQTSTFQMVAGMSLTRGESAESVEHQLTGPVKIEGTQTLDDHVPGHPTADASATDVWVPTFDQSTSAWRVFDITRDAPRGEGNANGATAGLFARAIQTPGRLFLDFTDADTQTQYQASKNFSAQKWYRYGYVGGGEQSGIAGMNPTEASPEDYAQAVAFQIRLDEAFEDAAGIVSLVLDKNPEAKVQVFYVEESAASNRALTLTLTTGKDATGKDVEPLVIHKNVVAAARLDVSNDKRVNALNLRPGEGLHTPVHRGNTSHNHGAYIVGSTEVDWDFGAESSVPRLEVVPGAELSFTVGQDFRTHGTTVVAQGKETSTFPKPDGSVTDPSESDLTEAAWIHHMSGDPFLGVDVELGEGAIFGFHAEANATDADIQNEGVVLSGELRLTGNATLRADFESASGGAGAARLPHFVAAGGIHATTSGLTLIVDAPTHQSADGQGGTVAWHCHTATLTGDDFRLWKTGPGTMTFYANTPPSVTGKVTVEEGTLAVTTATDTPIGAQGLHVEKDATLADNGRMTGTTRRIAHIPAGQTLSGGGTVKGILRLESGATYVAKQDEALTADGISVDASLEADITIDLPEDYTAGTPYLKANREERNVRGRLLPMKRTAEGEARWDSIAWIDNGATTTYAARPPQVPAPTDYKDYVAGESPTTITGTIEGPLTQQYQNAGHAYIGATFGRTRAGTYKLNPTELSDALLCFSNISAFVPASETQGTREYVDGTNFYVGYEFGISRQALVTIDDTEYVVLEVSVVSVFNDKDNPFEGVTFSPAQKAFVADFSGTTKLSFDLIDANGEAHPLGEDGLKIPVDEVTGMNGTPIADTALLANRAATPGKRWFRIPLAKLREAAPDGNIRLRASATSPYAKRL